MSPAEPFGLRVALCAAGEIWGGVEQFIETEAFELQRRGIPFVALLLNEGALAKRLRDASLPVEVVPSVSRYDPGAASALARALRAHAADVVHVHGYKASILAGAAARMQGRTVVKTEHGRLEPFQGWGRVKMTMNLWLDEALSRRTLHAIVFVSRDIQRGLGERYRHIPQEVIYNAIRPSTARAEEVPPLQPEEAFRIGIVGRLKPVKGHETLLRALALPAVPRRVHVYVFGEGPLEAELVARAAALGVHDRVHFLGFRENMAASLRRLDAVAMPSLHEGIPYAALETLDAGVPLVASDVGGLHEILEDGKDALLTPAGDAEALGRALARLESDAELRARLARHGRETVAARFLAGPMVDRYLEVYRLAHARATAGARP